MEDQTCPRCKTTKYRNPSLKLMVNVCGHTLCESCVDLLFLKGSGACPECLVPLRRSNFRIQLFDDPKIEKEIDIRKKVLRDYNKKEGDFNNLNAYNDYLEEIETIIYNLCNNIDVLNTNKKIEQYKKENRDAIMKNKSKIGRDEYELEKLLELEKQQEESRFTELQQIEQKTKKKKIMAKEALIDELIASKEEASKILDIFAVKAEKTEDEPQTVPVAKPATQFSTGIKFSLSDPKGFFPIPKYEEGPLYVHSMPKILHEGPPIPSSPEIILKGFIHMIRAEQLVERAGGFKSKIACQRALQEAFQCLYQTTS